jgi:hypothetical protein
VLGSLRSTVKAWPRTPFGVLLAAATLIGFGTLVDIVGLFASVIFADDGSRRARDAHARIRVGMTFQELNEITATLPHTHWRCEGPAAPTYPPCTSLRVEGQGSWLSSHSFQVSVDRRGIVTAMTVPEYDAW